LIVIITYCVVYRSTAGIDMPNALFDVEGFLDKAAEDESYDSMYSVRLEEVLKCLSIAPARRPSFEELRREVEEMLRGWDNVRDRRLRNVVGDGGDQGGNENGKEEYIWGMRFWNGERSGSQMILFRSGNHTRLGRAR
jgi:hypothetical protein